MGQGDLDDVASQIMASMHSHKTDVVKRINEVQSTNASRRMEAAKRMKAMEARVTWLETRLAELERTWMDRLRQWWSGLRSKGGS